LRERAVSCSCVGVSRVRSAGQVGAWPFSGLIFPLLAIAFNLSQIYSRAHSFGHFEKYVLLTARTFTSRLLSARSADFIKFWCYYLKLALTLRRLWCDHISLSPHFFNMHEVVPRAVKSAGYPALLRKVRAFDKTDQN
jgi:hypothetical protein